MGESGVTETEVGGQIYWEHMFDEIPEDLSLFDPSLLLSHASNPSPPDSFSLSIDEIEQMLMEEDDDKTAPPPPPFDFPNDFLSDIILDSPVESPEIVDLPHGNNNNNNANPSSSSSSEEEHERIDVLPQDENNRVGDDPTGKKRQRQLRNRDAAVRSRERKKMYVRDLEIKSKYLEGECRRLGMLLQCCCAENQALRLSLQNAKAYDASMTKQESAVLLLESLLLGSLLWFLAIVCLSTLPGQLQLNLEAVPPENVDKKNQGSLVVRKAGSKVFGLSFMVGKRCKASRSRMKPSCLIQEVLV